MLGLSCQVLWSVTMVDVQACSFFTAEDLFQEVLPSHSTGSCFHPVTI